MLFVNLLSPLALEGRGQGEGKHFQSLRTLIYYGATISTGQLQTGGLAN